MEQQCSRGLLSLLLACLALATAPPRSWGQQDTRIGTVVAVDGVAEVCASSANPCADRGYTWEALQFRAVLFAKDIVRTKPDSKVKVLLRDESIMTLAENSQMEFSEFLLDPQKNQRRTVVSLAVGKLRVLTTALFGAGSSTEVRTANTVAGVRGTTFVVIFIPPSTTEVLGLDGVVSVRHVNPAIPQIEPLQQNFRTLVIGNTAPSQAAVIPAAERQALERDLRLTEQVPAEVKPTGQGSSTGTIRGEAGEDTTAERSGTPTARAVPIQAGAGPGQQAPDERLEQLLDRARSVQAAHAPEPSQLRGTPLITPDNLRAQNTLLNTQRPNLRLTISIPRN